MNKIISIDKLEIGMEVVALDKSWLETNILFHRFRIQSLDEIQKLRDNGIRRVTIRLPDPQPVPPPAEYLLRSPIREDAPSEETSTVREMVTLTVPSLEEWTILHEKTIAVVTKSFNDIRMGNPLLVDPLRQQVLATLEMLLRDPRKNSFLVTLSEVDDESYLHSTNTMILAMGMGLQDGVPRDELPKWGLAALLHDIGKALIPIEILKKPGKLNPSEWEAMKRHPQLGYAILSKSLVDPIRGVCMSAAIEHHERNGGVGYPFGLDLPDLNPVSRSLMVLDIYEALTAGRVYRSALSPAKTLSYLLEKEIQRLDPRAVVSLVQMVGIYPVGSLVQLMDEQIAMVTGYKDPSNTAGQVDLMVIFKKLEQPLPEPIPLTQNRHFCLLVSFHRMVPDGIDRGLVPTAEDPDRAESW